MVNTNDLSKATIDELKFTANELEELKNARNMPIVFDDDCPETTPTKALKYRRVNPARSRESVMSRGCKFKSCHSEKTTQNQGLEGP